MTYKADCEISQPKDQGTYQNRRPLGGFGWHPDRGLFIPVLKEDNIALPYPSGMNPKTIVDPATVIPLKSTKDMAPVAVLPAIDYDYRP